MERTQGPGALTVNYDLNWSCEVKQLALVDSSNFYCVANVPQI